MLGSDQRTAPAPWVRDRSRVACDRVRRGVLPWQQPKNIVFCFNIFCILVASRLACANPSKITHDETNFIPTRLLHLTWLFAGAAHGLPPVVVYAGLPELQ